MTSKTWVPGTNIDSAWLQDADTMTYHTFFNVMSYGAKGDGVTDDTTAIQNAINAAQQVKGTVYFPPVTLAYLTTGLTIGVNGTNQVCNLLGGGYDTSGGSQSGLSGQFTGQSKIKLITGSSGKNVLTIARDAPAPWINFISFDGNGPNVTGTSYCIYKADTSAQPYYTYSIRMENCFVQNGKTGGIYIGSNCGAGLFKKVEVQYCGTTTSDIAVNVRCFDQQFSSCEIGPNPGIGMYIGLATQIQLTDCNFFINYVGLFDDGNAGSVMLTNCFFDSNLTYGTKSFGAASGGVGYGGRTFMGCHWQANGGLAYNTYSDILIDSNRRIALIAPSFNGNKGGSNLQKYNIEFASSSQTPQLQLFAPITNITTGTLNGSGFTNDYTKIYNGFFGTTPVTQPLTTGTTSGFTANVGTGMNSASTTTGGTGTQAYTFGDVVLALKQLGLLKT